MPVLSQLACARCGGTVSPLPDGTASCDRCQRPYVSAQSVAPSTTAAVTTATAVAAAPAPNPPPRHIPGPNSPQAPGPQHADYALGQRVWVFWGRSWWRGSIVRVASPGAWEITYTGWGANWDEVAGLERLADASGSDG